MKRFALRSAFAAAVLGLGIAGLSFTGNANIVDPKENCFISGKDDIPVNLFSTSFNAATGTLTVDLHYDGMRQDYPELYEAYMKQYPVAPGTVVTHEIGDDHAYISSIGRVDVHPHGTGYAPGRGHDLSANDVNGRLLEVRRDGPHWDHRKNVDVALMSTSIYEGDGSEENEFAGHFSASVEAWAIFNPYGAEPGLRVTSWNNVIAEDGGQFICRANVTPITGVSSVKRVRFEF